MYIFKKKILKLTIPILDAAGWITSLPFRLFEEQTGNPKNILAVRLDHIGDVLMTTPAIDILKKRYPDARITMLVGSWAKEVVQNNPDIDEIIIYDPPWFARPRRKARIRDLLRLISQLKAKKFDLGIDLRGDFRNIAIMWLGQVRYRIGYGITGGGFLLNKIVPYSKGKHEIEYNMDLVYTFGFKVKPQAVKFYPKQEDEEIIDKFLLKNGINDQEKFICVHAGAGFPSKLWRADRFARLIDRISGEFGIKVILTGSKSDIFPVMDILSLVNTKCVSAVGKTTLSQLGWLAKKSRLFISTDSGPAHIAAAVGAPLLMIYSGTNDPRQWAPLGENVKMVRKEVPCSACEKKFCKEKTCMKLIEVEDVFKAAKEFLGETKECVSV